MKKTNLLLLALAVVALLTLSVGKVFANISGSKHDLSSSGTNAVRGDIDEICIYCHTPHGGDQGSNPLWNRSGGTAPGAFSMYTSSTVTQTAAAPGNQSLACLSCHDGATSVNSLLNYGGAPYTTGTSTTVFGIANLGTDLTNDHPVGVSVTASGDAKIKSPAGGIGVKVYGSNSTVECPSCHNPHDTSNSPFLVAANTNSAICLECHDI